MTRLPLFLGEQFREPPFMYYKSVMTQISPPDLLGVLAPLPSQPPIWPMELTIGG